MKKQYLKKVQCFVFLGVISMMAMGCSVPETNGVDLNFLSLDETYEKSESNQTVTVKDKDSLYEDEDAVKVIYLTVGQGSREDGTNHTWEELNENNLALLQEKNLDPYQCEAVLQFGNEDGPVMGEFGFGDTSANATVKLTGQKASLHQQKNYKISIKSGLGSVDGMKDLILTKSFTDPFRFTNKLCYELMEEIPEMLSTRTSFVHLYVKDVTESKDTKFVDYGIYTMVEPINKRYLKNRGLNKSGELYKAVNFDFKRHEDVILQPTNASFQKDKFEQRLESKGSNDYTKLLSMLDAVNDTSLSTQELIEAYFDKDNLYSFMAFQMLVDNQDTATENYYLYSPEGTDKFYFISWDLDGALRSDYVSLRDSQEEENRNKGIFLFTDSVLFQRVLQDQACVNELSEKVDQLHNGALKPQNVKEKATEYAKLIQEELYTLPDMSYARVTSAQYKELISALEEQMDQNFYAYYESLETPWPFHIEAPKVENGKLSFTWTESYLMNQDVTYDILVDTSWDFSHPVSKQEGLTEPSYSTATLSTGQYFVKVLAKSETGKTQKAMEYYNTEKKVAAYGVLCFYVKEDGTIAESVFE